jgi:glycosyltransferase involved in cell wall biosynthesis
MSARRLLVNASGVNTGGGLVLLLALSAALQRHARALLLDERLRQRGPAFTGPVSVTYVRRSFLARLRSLMRLSASATSGDVLFCFNGLPPLARSRARVIAYVQAPHFVGAHRSSRYSRLTALRIFIERLWFRSGVRFCDELWVQSQSMADALGALYPRASISIVPLVDDELRAALGRSSSTSGAGAPADGPKFSFFYPADAVGHKNHVALLKAWRLLAQDGEAPGLLLTLEQVEFEELLRSTGIRREDLSGVTALGRIPRADVLQRLAESSALIFPSMAETYGLPMLEASALGVPILAAERDFVRDVCSPAQTFDPTSPRSIAAAVRRFMHPEARVVHEVLSGDAFVDRLLA